MWDLGLAFDKPWWLLLALAVPVLWRMSYKTLAGLGPVRRLAALTLRTIVFLLIVLALAEVQLSRTSDRVTVIYLLDQSESIPAAKRHLMFDYVVRNVAGRRDAERGDRAGVIVFGSEAAVEIPPFDEDVPSLDASAAYLDLRTDATDLEAALKLAQASFPEDTAKRIVLVTDGNENLGAARPIGAVLADQSIGIDVLPVELTSRAEVAVERLDLPSEIRRGQPMEARVILNNDAPAGTEVRGRLRVTRRVGRSEELLAEQEVVLAPGKRILRFEHQIDRPAVYAYRAVFTPDDARDDLMPQNNHAEAITHVRGEGRVLLIEDADHVGQFDFLVETLRKAKLEVEVRPSDQLFTSLAELQGYDSVVLANVPRSQGESAEEVTNFSDEQIRMLVRNTEKMGCGLVMLGGENSFGAGGWANTELEKAMPVDFQVKNAKVRAVGALVLMMHASEMPQGNYWQKVVGREAIKALGPMDYCGVLYWSNLAGKDAWLWGGAQGLIRVGNQRPAMLARLNRMTPGDMPYFGPAMQMAFAGFQRVNASAKHMIVLSDGDPAGPSAALLARYAKAGIKVSTVAIGAHGSVGAKTLQDVATATDGNYYVVTSPQALPRIYQREARRVAKPLVYEPEGGVTPRVTYRHEMLRGIDGPLRPIRGFVLTTVKDDPLVEVSIVSPQPDGGRNSTILASWTYGLGRTVAFTCDAGAKWADQWTDWPDYGNFFSQMVRWSMRPTGEEGRFTVATDVRDGVVRIAVTALDQNDEFLNLLDMSATAVAPDLESFDVPIRQTAAGRYVGQFPADQAGSYFLTLNPGAGRPPILAGVNVPYSAEFRDRETNLALLSALAELTPRGGRPGRLIAGDLSEGGMDALLESNPFRRKLPRAARSQSAWFVFALLSVCVFFGDVLVRRVAFGHEWLVKAARWVRQTAAGPPPDEAAQRRLQRLRGSKAQVAQRIDERRAAARFQPDADKEGEALPAEGDLDRAVEQAGAGAAAPPAAPLQPEPSEEDTSYTARLLEAKKRAWKNRKP